MLGLTWLRGWLASISRPLPYTSNSLYLFGADLALFIWLSITWPGLFGIVWPWRPCPSGPLDELYLSRDNLWPDIVHFLLFWAQVSFLGSLIWCLVSKVSAPWFIGWIALFIAGNMLICRLVLSGLPGREFSAGKEFAKDPGAAGEKWMSSDPSHEGEKWVFINGVAVGSHWMSSNLIRLSKTFRRPILGIYNPSYGIPFDVLESMFQRTFGYPTLDIRNAYQTLSMLVQDKDIKKLVLIAHSQGAIELGMVLDWIYATIPLKHLSKLEVFTFGNAANHWNCPMGIEGPVIEHMEHYVNDGDWVARFGILHYRQTNSTKNSRTSTAVGSQGTSEIEKMGAPQIPVEKIKKNTTSGLNSKDWQEDRFKGRMFQRTGCTGHMMNQHYLDNLFIMDEELKNVLDQDTGNASTRFMDMEVDQQMLDCDDIIIPVLAGKQQEVHRKVSFYSRLWKYRNGETPDDWMFHDRKTQ